MNARSVYRSQFVEISNNEGLIVASLASILHALDNNKGMHCGSTKGNT